MRRIKHVHDVFLTNVEIRAIDMPWHGGLVHRQLIGDMIRTFSETRSGGQLWPKRMPKVVITADMLLIDGNHRISAADAAGWTEVLAVIVPQWTWEEWISEIDEDDAQMYGPDFDGYMAWVADRSPIFSDAIRSQE